MTQAIAGVIVLALGYFGYSHFFGGSSSTTVPTVNLQLGKNMANFLQVISKGDIDLDAASILSNKYVQSLQDHTQTFTYSNRRGRLDPFLPYDSTRPIR